MPSCVSHRGSHSTPTQPWGFCSRRRTFPRCFLFVFCIIFLSPLPPGKSSSRIVCRVLSKFAKPFLVYRGLICSESLVGTPISCLQGGGVPTQSLLMGRVGPSQPPLGFQRDPSSTHSLLLLRCGIIFFPPVFFFSSAITHSFLRIAVLFFFYLYSFFSPLILLFLTFFLCYVLLDGKVHVPTCYL